MERNRIKQILDSMSREIDLRSHRNYWMIRTDSGKSYKPFLQHGIVALRQPYISQEFATYVYRRDMPAKMAIDEIKAHLETISNDASMQTIEGVAELKNHIYRGNRASQLYTFIKVLKKGDVVLVPSEGATYISIGIIEDDYLVINERLNNNYPICKAVKWINQISKNRLDPGLYRALGAHQAISNLSDYEEFIERNCNSCFVKDNICNYVLTLNSADINAEEFFELGNDLLKLLRFYNKKYSLGINPGEISLSMNLNSPGKIVFKSAAVSIVYMMMALLSACSDGQIVYDDNEKIQGNDYSTLVDSLRNDTDGSIDAIKDHIGRCLRSTEAKAVERWNRESLGRNTQE